MIKIFIAPVLLLLCQFCFAQAKVTILDKKSLPKKLPYSGQIVNAVRWTDNSGENIVITTETGETTTKGQDDKNAALFGYHYLLQADTGVVIWKLHDFIKECPVDVTAGFIKNSFAITDLDKDGKAEIWLMYKTACRGDVSPANMKIIMYQDGKKYAVRGTTKVQVSEKEFTGGEYDFDEAFKKAPETFRQYATRLWKKNILETWD